MPESVCLALAVRPALCQRLRALTTSPRSRSLCAHVPDGEAEAWEVSGLTAEGRAQAPGAERRPSPASSPGALGGWQRWPLRPRLSDPTSLAAVSERVLGWGPARSRHAPP